MPDFLPTGTPVPIRHSSASVRHAPGHQSLMDVEALESAVQGLFAEGLAGSTRSSYSTAQKRYLTFCSLFNLSPLPLSEHTLCLFAAFLANEGLQARTISAYLSGLRHFQISAGLPPPPHNAWPWLHYVTRGIKRTQEPTHRSRMPITIAVMNKLRAVWLPLNQAVHPFNNVLYWAAACTAFFGFLRLGEVFPKSAGEAPPLQLRDLSTDSHTSPSFIKLLIRRSKTDPFGRGLLCGVGEVWPCHLPSCCS